MTFILDDESVVGKIFSMTLRDYLNGVETTRPFELMYGVVREPPAPGWDHQIVAGRIHVKLDAHTRRFDLGRVVQSPIDVILDAGGALVVQPDIVFVSKERLDICRERVWGSPDLVVEILSVGTRRHDTNVKVAWYRQYGVRECWLVDPVSREIAVLNLEEPNQERCVFVNQEMVRSRVRPRLRMRAEHAFRD